MAEVIDPISIITGSAEQVVNEDAEKIIENIRERIKNIKSFRKANDLTMKTIEKKTKTWEKISSLSMTPIYSDYINLLTIIETLYSNIDEIEKEAK